LLGVGVEEELVRIEAVPRLRLVGPMNPVAVHLPRASLRQIAMEDLVGVFRQLDPLDLPLSVDVEKAELDLRGVCGEQGEIYAAPIPGRPQRGGMPAFDPGSAQARVGTCPGTGIG